MVLTQPLDGAFSGVERGASFIVSNGWELEDIKLNIIASCTIDSAIRSSQCRFGYIILSVVPGPFMDVLATAVQRHLNPVKRLCLRFTDEKTRVLWQS